jgi:sigma-E factor negative regulatory protein RseA
MQVSAFVDGELPENEAGLLLRRMSQDVELRKEVAEYLAIGRLIRAEPGLAGTDRLHERIAAAIDERPAEMDDAEGAAPGSRAVRPLAGVAIAATVALVGIFALQQIKGVEELPTEGPLPVVVEVVPNIDAQQERQRQYLLNHAETSSQMGANGMNSRVVTLQFSEEVTPNSEADEPNEQDDSIENDDSPEATVQP